ncbi:MAG: hypothetical protein MK133_17410, partial [Planctomycetes bacterium]|nr:hypothetical protein [Planctomycetota bacterium]
MNPKETKIDGEKESVYHPKMVRTRATRHLFKSMVVIALLQAVFSDHLEAQPKLHTWFHYHGKKSLE